MKTLTTVLLTITICFSVLAQNENNPVKDPDGIQDSMEKAGQINSLVKYVRVDKTGKGYVQFVDPLVDTPASCGAGFPNVLAFNTTTDGGKAILSLVLTAKATGKKVFARGDGVCDIFSVIESWNYGTVLDY